MQNRSEINNGTVMKLNLSPVCISYISSMLNLSTFAMQVMKLINSPLAKCCTHSILIYLLLQFSNYCNHNHIVLVLPICYCWFLAMKIRFFIQVTAAWCGIYIKKTKLITFVFCVVFTYKLQLIIQWCLFRRLKALLLNSQCGAFNCTLICYQCKRNVGGKPSDPCKHGNNRW